MRLEVTRRADLAVRALVLLGADGGRLKSNALAAALDTTAGFVPQVLGPLVARGWVRSEPGPTGGYACAVDLRTVSLLDVIEAIDGPTDVGRCVVEGRPCRPADACPLHHAWEQARQSMLRELRTTALADTTAARTPR